eukprot:EG_transcript_28582
MKEAGEREAVQLHRRFSEYKKGGYGTGKQSCQALASLPRRHAASDSGGCVTATARVRCSSGWSSRLVKASSIFSRACRSTSICVFFLRSERLYSSTAYWNRDPVMPRQFAIFSPM